MSLWYSSGSGGIRTRTGDMPKWEDELIKYGHIAYETGQKLEFNVIKRTNKRSWRIELKKIQSHGEDDFFEIED